MNEHNWIRSTYGHGETMCTKCGVTNREASVLRMYKCERLGAPPKVPTRSDNVILFTPKRALRAEGAPR